MASRPSKQRLRQRGILRERVFGTDLGEHLLNSGEEVPRVLLCCAQFLEKFGVVDGIYRLSGVSSNIQKLRHEFDSERIPDLYGHFLAGRPLLSSLCNLYFRELPTPLLTYRLYQPFTEAMSATSEMRNSTLEYYEHLSRLSTHSCRTGMHARNLASKDMELAGTPGADAFARDTWRRRVREVRVQSVLVEFLLCNVETLFSDTFTSIGRCGPIRPRSLLGVCPSGRLVSLQEAQARSQSQREAAEKLGMDKAYPTRNERVLESIEERKAVRGRKKSGGGSSWRTFFAIGKNSSQHKKSRSGGIADRAAHQRVSDSVTLRSAKSEESLCSHTSGTGLQGSSRLRRPRSTSDGLTARLQHCHSVESLGPSSPSPPCAPSPPSSARPQSAWIEEDLDLSTPLPDTDGLGFDPLSFRLSFSDHGEMNSPSVVKAEITTMSKALPRQVSLSPTGGCSPSPSHSPPEKLVTDGEVQVPRSLSPPPQMLSLLLQSCQLRLSENCAREVKGKIMRTPSQEEPHHGLTLSSQKSGQPSSLSIVRHIPPPPPPKDPARLMALKLAESAQRAIQASISTGTAPAKASQRSAPRLPLSSSFRRSLSMECSESTVIREGPLYSELRPPVPNASERHAPLHRPLRLPMHNTMAPGSSSADVKKMTPSGFPSSHAPRLHTRSGSLPAPPTLCAPRLRPPPYRLPEEGPRLPHQLSAPPWTEPEGLYYEILGDPPQMASLNTSYGLIQPPWPRMNSSHAHAIPPPGFGSWYGGHHPTDPEVMSYQRWDRGPHPQLRPYFVGRGVQYQYVRTPETSSNVLPVLKRDEPIYVNLPLKVDRVEQLVGTNDIAGMKTEVSQKPRQVNPASVGRHESTRGATHSQRQLPQQHTLRREGSLGYFRPLPSHNALWGTQPKLHEGRETPIFTYQGPEGGQRLGYGPSHCLLSEEGTLYGNLEQRGAPHRSSAGAGPPGFLGAPWTVHSEGQTRSYC
ncbi:hypothetical protein GDO86_012132 [Hymenochirus boettgeri]|nr:hypothetical protein GDO86_012132 [Hymenochirus boettgeri]